MFVKLIFEEIERHRAEKKCNLRVFAYLNDGLVRSKKEGGEWAINNIPEMYHGLIQDAMREYADGADIAYETNIARDYAGYMVEQITNVRKKIGAFYEDLLSITKIKLLY